MIDTKLMTDREFFDSIAHTWDASNDSSTPAKIGRVLDLAGIACGMDILDVGTGTGVLLPYLAARIGPSGSITAVDLSQNMLDIATRKARQAGYQPQPGFLRMNVEEQLPPGRYDLIMLYCVFPHIHHPEETLSRLVRQSLRPGGRIVIAHPTSRHFINRVHGHRPIHSEGLASGEEVRLMLAPSGLSTRVVEDSDELYLLIISTE